MSDLSSPPSQHTMDRKHHGYEHQGHEHPGPEHHTHRPGGGAGASAEAARGSTHTCPMHPEVRNDGPGACPKCGMALEPLKVAPSGAMVEWTCPMHPQIVRDRPGFCPICGMALEPWTVSGDEENPELRDMTRRFWLATALTAPIVLMALGDMVLAGAVERLLPMRARTLFELLVATPVCVWAAWPFYLRAVASVRNRSLNMFTLIGLGVFVAYGYSVVAALLPGVFPAGFRDGGARALR